jgi:predicted Zn finger-like uncharacterized protein
MPQNADDNSPLQIRCPSCGQRFKVDLELRNRTVECGSCEHRFRVDDAVIFKTRRYYPGERRDPALDRYQRVPMGGSMSSLPLQTIQYATTPDPVHFEPVSPQRVLAGALGVILMILVGSLLVVGASRGSVLDGTPTSGRLVMAAFAAIVGGIMLWYANPRARIKAVVVAAVFAVGLMALPFIFTEGSKPLEASGTAPDLPLTPVAPESANDPYEVLRKEIGTEPIEAENARLAAEGSDRIAVGLWLRGLSEIHRHAVRDFFYRVTPADRASSYIYPRYGGGYLMMLSGLEADYIPQLAQIAGRLGTMERIHHELNVIEVLVNNEVLNEPPPDIARNSEAPGFFDANKAELESVSPIRVVNAAQRLASAEPTVYRSDISRRLSELLEENDIEVQEAAAKALMVWAEDLEAAARAAAEVAIRLEENDTPAPDGILELAIAGKASAIIPILDKRWMSNPTAWEDRYGRMGAAIEPILLERLPRTAGGLRHSLLSLLSRVGGKDSLKALEAASAQAQGEYRAMINQVMTVIRERLE